ncbi:MAG TPA: hypothetical protein VKJ65_14315 [Phycisphaerae bacterium]|nr:hypothetical protein [Phycisphaerae bacterium]
MADKTRFAEAPKATMHPLGWDCADCFHVVKQLMPDRGAGQIVMKCCRYPPTTQGIFGPRGEFIGSASIVPAVNPGEFCGEFTLADKLPWDKIPKTDA